MFIRCTVLLSCLFLVSCGLKLDNQGGEPATKGDAPPPTGYSPVYLKSISPITAAQPTRPLLAIHRIDATKPNSIKVYMHFLDSGGTYYTGALNGKFKSWWCDINDEFNGRKQQIKKYTLREITEDERMPHAIALVMDHSGSMGEERALAVQEAADLFVSRKKAEDAIALIKYDNNVGVEAPLLTESNQLRMRLQKTGLRGYGNLTAVLNGIHNGLQQVATADPAVRKAVVVFTDGVDNSSTIAKDSIIALARRTNTAICAVDFGYGVQEGFLKELADATGGSYHRMYSTNEFDDVFDDIYRRLHNYYVLEFAPMEYGAHTLRLKLCLPSDTVVATAAYDNTPEIGAAALIDINFDSDKSVIKQNDVPSLDNVYALMKAHPTLHIELHGHTDNANRTSDPEYNLKLSQRRADAVKEYLVKKGIAAERIKAIGFGDTRPVADNATNEGKAANRRTEFVVVRR